MKSSTLLGIAAFGTPPPVINIEFVAVLWRFFDDSNIELVGVRGLGALRLGVRIS